MPKLFGTNGIRGPASTLFTKQFCLEVGSVFGTWLKSRGKTGYVAVAMDPRESSPVILDYVCRGLARQGFEILDEGVIPTPALTYFVKKSSHAAGGIMVTGSHIKADLNGVKLLVDGEEVNKDQEKEIEALFGKTKSDGINPIVKSEDTARDLYIEMLVNMADLPYPKWKIVVDTANGTQTEITQPLFDALGLDFESDNDIQSDYFVPRDTESNDSVAELSKRVLQSSADLGVAFDVDGDRVVFVDNHGDFVPGDYSCALIATDPIVTTISTADVVTNAHRTKIGATYVITKMKEVGAKFGFEPNGGGIFADNFYGRDGGATLIALLNIMKKSRLSLADNLSSLPKYYLFKDKIDCLFDKYDSVLGAVKLKFADKKIDETDGLKVSLGEGEWILFRGSGNAPEFRVFVQSKDAKIAKSQGQKYLAWVKDLATSTNKIHGDNVAGHKDSLGIEETINELPDQLTQVLDDMAALKIDADLGLVENVVLAGMGGSALGGRVVGNFKKALKLPFEVVTGYDLPKYVDEKTLLILSSYSGGTAEVLSCAAAGTTAGAKMFVITTGGKLADLKIDGYIFDPKYDPAGMPRMGVGYSIFSVLILLLRLGLISNFASIHNLAAWLKNQQNKIRESAQKLALDLDNKHVIFLAAGHLLGAAHVTKNNLNENSKQIAYLFDLPEADHHLLEGLSFPTSLGTDSCFVLFNSDLYSPVLQKQIAVTAEVIAKRNLKLVQIQAAGEDILQQAFYCLHLGQYLSFYLAQAYRIDPGPIPWVDYIKEHLTS